MGVVREGSISGFLPSSKAFAVHYPGYPSSTARALETLGGTEGIVKARTSQSNKLELHFRPEDPYSHPTLGELHPCHNFLLRISKRKIEDGAGDSSRTSECPSAAPSNIEQNVSLPELMETAEEVNQPATESIAASTEVEAHVPDQVQEDLFADITARVSEAYQFNGMADYQHVLAVHADVARKRKRNWADLEPQFEKGSLLDVDQEDLMILVPPIFSPKDIPENVVLKPSVDVSLKKKQEGVVQHRWEMDIEPSLAIDFYIKEIPKKVTWEKYVPQDSEQWQWQMAVSKLFDERPIWVKHSLAERLLDKGLQFGGNMLRRLLFRTAYYFSNGPFLRFWIRKGYDPRKDPESRIYQRIDFRVPPSLRGYCDTNIESRLKHRWEDICAFRVFPYKCQISLQLFELADDYIQQEIRKPSKQTTCSCATGWFSSRVLDTLRFCVAVRFLSAYPRPGAESLLKSASNRFEKSKRTQIFVKDLRLDEEGKQKVNKGNEEKNMNDVEEDDEEEEDDEIEEENAEEELDEYEALNLAGEDNDFSSQPSSYTNSDNISKNYLQELFGSFPFSEAGASGLLDAGNSDEEYQIYEQFSDGMNSDDDGN